MSTKADRIFKAKMCEQSERYEDMVNIFKITLSETVELDNEERNLFSAAYKYLIGSRRTAYRALSAILSKEESKEDKEKAASRGGLIKSFKEKVVGEISKICTEVTKIITDKLLPAATKEESKLFYIKMKGDYYRYNCECLTGDELKSISEKARATYDEASKSAEKSLAVTDPIRLGLSLNFSVFHYEILNDPTKACKIAKEAFDGAISQLEGLDDEHYKDTASILQLLRDNLTLWQNEGVEQAEN